jgi:hypothetical protein
MDTLADCDHVALLGASIRLAIGGTFALAGGLKWWQRVELTSLVSSLGLPPSRLVTVSLVLLPVAELLLGMWLIVGLWIGVALGITLLVVVGFTAALLLAISRRYRGGCACFGTIDNGQLGPIHVGRNIVLLAATVFVAVQVSQGSCVTAPAWDLPAAVFPAAAAVLLAGMAMWALMAEVASLLQRATELSENTR